MRTSRLPVSTQQGSWHPPSLCLHHFSTPFDSQQVQVLADGLPSSQTVTWAVGVLTDGDWEPLGAGPGAAVGPAFWQSVRADLLDRGVEKLSWVNTPDLEHGAALFPGVRLLPPFPRVLGPGYASPRSSLGALRASARRAVRGACGIRSARVALTRVLSQAGGAPVLTPACPAVPQPLRQSYALKPQRRAVVRQGDELLEPLQVFVHRAVRRHGPFADLDAAARFVGWTLCQAQGRVESAVYAQTVGADLAAMRRRAAAVDVIDAASAAASRLAA